MEEQASPKSPNTATRRKTIADFIPFKQKSINGKYGIQNLVQFEAYSSGEEFPEQGDDFNAMLSQDKSDHVVNLWKTLYLKAVGAVKITKVFEKITQRLMKYGSTKNINAQQSEILKQKIMKRKSGLILTPENAFIKVWNIIMTILLLYVASYVPYNICFNNTLREGLNTGDYIDIVVDVLFFIDIIINFFSSYDDPETGLPVIDFKTIANRYLSTWFALDFITVLPVSLIEDWIVNEQSALSGDTQQLKLARLARIPRIYRIIRILRMSKIIRVAKKQGLISDFIEDLNISIGTARMLKVLALQIFLLHIVSCFWYLFASLEDNMFDTWVGGRGIVDSNTGYLYFNSFYWAFQTTTTVGYGDFSMNTYMEYIIAILWMVVGTNFFSFTIGSVSTMIAALDEKERDLNQKLNTLLEYSKKYMLPKDSQSKVKNFFQNSHRNNLTDNAWDILFDSLPPALRKDIVNETHGKIIKQIVFFSGKPPNFLIRLIPKMDLLLHFENDILYSQGDSSGEIFFILKGSVLLYLDITDHINLQHSVSEDQAFNLPICQYQQGSYFGDNDVFLSKIGYRSHTAKCASDCQIYTAKILEIESILETFDDIRDLMHDIAKEKQRYYQTLVEEVKQRYKTKPKQEELYNLKKDLEETSYMSIKRRTVKKNIKNKDRINKLMQKNFNRKKPTDKERALKADEKEQKRKRREMLGDEKASTHLDSYTHEFKSLLSKLDSAQINSRINGSLANNYKKETKMNKTTERKEKLKTRLYNESQMYFQNNINMFTNGMSLLSVNALESNSRMHQMKTQIDQQVGLSTNINEHCEYMTKTTKSTISNLKKIAKKVARF